ncbi:MAG: hypothetical protein JO119_11855 [Acidobacteria bacterium]|nr:hypothetical protein [Acidobacteriota bacterium]
MGALENLLSEKIKRASVQLADGELVVPYLEALEAIRIATENEIAVLSVDSHEMRDGSILTIDLYDGSTMIKYAGDWRAFVQQLNDAAEDWITGPRLGQNHGYILTSASRDEFSRLKT